MSRPSRSCSGWGERSATNLLRELDEARKRPLHRLLFALGIPHVGERAARLLAGRVGSLEELAAADPGALEEIDGIGPVIANAVARWFADARGQEYDQTSCRAGDRSPRRPGGGSKKEAALVGQTFVLTGSLSRPRRELKEELEGLGATGVGLGVANDLLSGGGGEPGHQARHCSRARSRGPRRGGIERLLESVGS